MQPHLALALGLWLATLHPAAAQLDPRAVTFHLPDQIPWGPVTPNGNQQAVLVGDPSKLGFTPSWSAGCPAT